MERARGDGDADADAETQNESDVSSDASADSADVVMQSSLGSLRFLAGGLGLRRARGRAGSAVVGGVLDGAGARPAKNAAAGTTRCGRSVWGWHDEARAGVGYGGGGDGRRRRCQAGSRRSLVSVGHGRRGQLGGRRRAASG